MDVNLPRMNGFDATRRIMETTPTPIVIVSASSDAAEVEQSLRAMESGALAVLAKPHGADSPQSAAECRELVTCVKLMSEVKVVRRWSRKPMLPGSEPSPVAATSVTLSRAEAVVIGASTGGPLPVRTILSSLPANFPAAVLVVQHIAAGFGPGFVEWLAGSSGIPVHVALDGEQVRPGHAYVAPDELHMGVRSGPRIELSASEPEEGLRPAVAYLFRTAAKVYGRRAIGILLSGMGRDGAEELMLLRDAGAVTFAQDRDSCAVFGMPGEAVKRGAALYTLPPENIAAALATLANATNGRHGGAA